MKKICILLVIAFCLVAFASCGNGGDKKTDPTIPETTSTNVFNKVAPDELKAIDDFKTFVSGKFFFTAVAEAEGMKIELSVLSDGKNEATVSSMDLFGKTIKTLQKDGYMYTIIDQAKKYSKEETGEEDGENEGVLGLNIDELKYVDVKDKEIDGKASKSYNFSVTPADSEDGKSQNFSICVAEGKIVAFLVDGETMNIKEFGKTAPSGLFDIPEGYTEVSSDELSSLLLGE